MKNKLVAIFVSVVFLMASTAFSSGDGYATESQKAYLSIHSGSQAYHDSDPREMDYLIQKVNASTERNYRMRRGGDLLAGCLSLGIAWWGYNSGQKVHGGATRDFCNFASAVFAVRGVVLLTFGGD